MHCACSKLLQFQINPNSPVDLPSCTGWGPNQWICMHQQIEIKLNANTRKCILPKTIMNALLQMEMKRALLMIPHQSEFTIWPCPYLMHQQIEIKLNANTRKCILPKTIMNALLQMEMKRALLMIPHQSEFSIWPCSSLLHQRD